MSVEEDEAGNLWARLGGRRDETVALGSHIDSVPNGGWLDGALGVMAALEALRVAAEEGAERSVALVDFADEEGARFGRSLFGSSAVAGTLDPAAVEGLTDADGRAIREVLAEHGVDLDAAPRAARMREGLAAYLELHIEQGPVLESEGIPVAAVTGTVGVERRRFRFEGQAAHAGTTPMDMRRDAGVAAATGVVAISGARAPGGRGPRRARCASSPGMPTAVPGVAEIVVDLRNPTAEGLAGIWRRSGRPRAVARDRGCQLSGVARLEHRADRVRRAAGGSGARWPPERTASSRAGHSTTRPRWPATCRRRWSSPPPRAGSATRRRRTRPSRTWSGRSRPTPTWRGS